MSETQEGAMATVTETGRRFLRLGVAECLRLLARGGVGRLAFANGPAPVILPVNFVLDGGAVVFRTADGTMLDERYDGEGVAFEVDEVDEVYRHAWSVLVRGRLERITDERELEGCAQLRLGVYAPGRRDHWFRVIPATVTGRAIR